jgi:hypothetical protein
VSGDEWTVVLGPGTVHAVRKQLSLWREAHGDVPEEDIRLDLIRVEGGDELRVCVRGTAS